MPNPFFTRPNWEDRQVVQYTGTSITLSGDTNINYTGNFRIYKDAFPGLVATSLDSNGTVGWGPISGISWSVSACTSPLYVNNLVSCPSSGGTIQVDAGNLALNSELNFLISLSAGTNTDEVLVIDNNGYVKTIPNLMGIGNMWHIPVGYTLTVPDDYQSFVYGDLLIEGVIDLQTNAQLVVLNGNIVLSGGSIVGSGTTYLVTLGGNSCCFTGGTGTCITDLYVSNIHSCSPLNINPLDEGNIYFGSTSGLTYDVINKRLGINNPNPSHTFDFKSSDSNTRFHYVDSSPTAQSIFLSGSSTVMPQLGVASSLSTLPLTIGATIGIIGQDCTLYPGYGNPLDAFLYGGADTNVLNIISAPTSSVGTNTDDIRFYAGQFVSSGYGADIHIQGKGVTRGFVGVGTETPTVKLHVSGETIVNSNKMMLSDSLTTIPPINFSGIFSVHDLLGGQGFLSSNTNPSGTTGFRMTNDSSVAGQLIIGGSQSTRGLSPVTGKNFYRNKVILKGDNTSEGMIFNAAGSDPSSTFWWEFNGASGMILKGDGSSTGAYLGLALNPDGTEMPTSNLQIGGTGTTGTFQYKDGNQSSGYILTSDIDGNATWQASTGGGSGTTIVQFTGNTSASCITDLYVTNVHGCSPITVWDSVQSNGSQATGVTSFAFGYQTLALGDYSHAEGWGSIASGHGSHAEGGYPGIFAGGSAIGDGSHAEGVLTVASGVHSHSENYYTTASGNFSHAEGNTTTAGGENSHSEGVNTQASGYSSHAEGGGTMASGQYSHAEGTFTVASGFYSHAEGANTVASGQTAHAEGTSTVAGGDFSHAEGNFTTASGPNSHSQGIYTIASGDGSHAGGYGDTLSKVIASQRGSFNHSVVDNTYSGTGSSNLGTFILGGFNNSVSTEWSGVLGGQYNIVRSGGLPVPYSSVIVGGSGNILNTGINSVILGGSGLTGTTSNTVYVPDFVIKRGAAVPTSATDTIGEIGSITYDNDYLYVKTPRSGGLWGRVLLDTSW